MQITEKENERKLKVKRAKTNLAVHIDLLDGSFRLAELETSLKIARPAEQK